MTTTATRRHPRFRLDVDWFVESASGSAMGRGLELSFRSALLPVVCTSHFTPTVTLHLSLPQRQKMFKAICSARQQARGWVLTFNEIAPDDLQLLGQALLEAFGEAALPSLLRRPETSLNL